MSRHLRELSGRVRSEVSSINRASSVHVNMQPAVVSGKDEESQKDAEESTELLLGVRVENLSPVWQFLFLVGGVMVFFMVYGYVQVRPTQPFVTEMFFGTINQFYACAA